MDKIKNSLLIKIRKRERLIREKMRRATWDDLIAAKWPKYAIVRHWWVKEISDRIRKYLRGLNLFLMYFFCLKYPRRWTISIEYKWKWSKDRKIDGNPGRAGKVATRGAITRTTGRMSFLFISFSTLHFYFLVLWASVLINGGGTSWITYWEGEFPRIPSKLGFQGKIQNFLHFSHIFG